MGECTAERALDLGPCARVGAQRVAGELVAVAPAGLGAVHRDVGEVQQLLGIVAPRLGQRHADARGERDHAGAGGHGLAERGTDPARHLERVALAMDVLAEHDELVATESRHGVAGAQGGVDAGGDRAQHLVARVVAVGVVDALEAVEVDEEHRDGPVATPRAQQRVAQALEEDRAVGEAREGIVGGEVERLLVVAGGLQGGLRLVGEQPQRL
jgi:hypothetical protein